MKIKGDEMSFEKKYPCPCCGYYTYSVSPENDCGYICQVCFWENDSFIRSEDEPSDSNHGITLRQARENYLNFGACEKKMLSYVRPPREDEKEPAAEAESSLQSAGVNYDTAQFKKDLSAFGIVLSEQQVEQFLTYYELLTDWNRKINLTAITEYEDVMKKHFVDSLSLIRAFDVTKGVSVIDVGTGAGFPGLALKIAFPNLKVTLLDSLNKRILFLDEVIKTLGLKGIKTIHSRAEDAARPGELRESFDLCVSRAVANLSTLSEYCLPFVRPGGRFISYKSEKLAEEIRGADKAISVMGGKLEKQVEFTLPDSDIYRNLVVIKKQKPTPKKYPRKAGLPSKQPL